MMTLVILTEETESSKAGTIVSYLVAVHKTYNDADDHVAGWLDGGPGRTGYLLAVSLGEEVFVTGFAVR
jgi:hypothetical protein